jgi:phosphate starvation-inducible protein PhoH and related proteins
MATDSLETLTLEFENARAVQALYGGDDKLLRELEAALDVRVTSREGWLRIEGGEEGVSRARRVFEQLNEARKRGVVIRRPEFNYAVNAAGRNGGTDLGRLLDLRIQTSARKPPVIPKTDGQKSYLLAMQTREITFGIGPAGTGKTYLAVATAVAALKQEKVNRIILTRPAVEAGEALGFLPGDLQEKILPYLRPLYDALYDMLEVEEIQKYMDRGVIEIAPLAYMRGRTLSQAFVILDEAQNTTTEQMFMFLTRLGQDSKCVITGDRTQVDLPRNKRSGLIEAVEALRKVEDIGFLFLDETDVVRHRLVQSIIQAYRERRGLQEERF